MVNKLIAIKGDKNTYEVNNFYTKENVFYLEFNRCLAASQKNEGGYIAKAGNVWIYASPADLNSMESVGDANEVRIDGIEITDQELIQWIALLFGKVDRK